MFSTVPHLLLSLLCLLGASVRADDGSGVIVQKFLDSMTTTVVSGVEAAIGALFSDEFEFIGCKGNYTKKKVVKMLSHLPAGANLKMTLKSSYYRDDNPKSNEIEYHVLVSGFGPSIEAYFLIHSYNGKWVLERGMIPKCPKRRPFGDDVERSFAVAVDSDSDLVAKNFIEKMVKVIESGDKDSISGLFADQFAFRGCKKAYNKKMAVEMLSQLPKGSTFSITFKRSRELSLAEIEYEVDFVGLGQTFDAYFTIHNYDGTYKLIYGSRPTCPKRISRFAIARGTDGSEVIAQAFVGALVFAIASKDETRLAKLIDDSFVLKGCKSTYTKASLLALIAKIPKGTDFSITFKESHYINGNTDIVYSVALSGLGPASEAQFVLHQSSGQFVLISGKVVKCPKSRRFGDDVERSFAVAVDSDSDLVAKNFIENMVKVIESGDKDSISGLFADQFAFKGCEGTYSKNMAVEMLSKLPKGSTFSITFKRSRFLSLFEVQYEVDFVGLGQTFNAYFAIHNYDGDYKLIYGSRSDCPKTINRFLMASGTDGSEVIAQAFVGALVSAIASKDETRLAKLIDDSFVLKGCKSTYTKASLLALIAKIPKGTDFSITFKESHYINDNTDIVYSVALSGLGPASEAQFVLHQSSGQFVLISGKVVKCPKRLLAHFVDDGSEAIVRGFLVTMQKAINSGNKTAIGSLFEDKYIFHGCKRDYSKKEVVKALSNLRSARSFNIVFKSSTFLTGENDIEYHAVAFGPAAEYILHTSGENHVLSSGRVEKCPDRRPYDFFERLYSRK
ncbi:unnamed protein product [Caenorhabditis sp. 36 PRJEB53466]|nr:unnamed protein product [Caenorhabditis sp. 36 PRJEB53466]